MDVVERIKSSLEPFGYECAPFLSSWYNAVVNTRFQLPYCENTLCISIVSAPHMFEKAFLPFVESSRDKLAGVCQDPLDQCTQHYFQRARDELCRDGITCEAVFDFDTLPSGQPRLLVQSAGHVSGQARFYQRQDVSEGPSVGTWPQGTRIYGACAHPKYGGWFAFRGAFILRDIQLPELVQCQPPDVMGNDERFRFLDLFNHHWRDGRFRDVPPDVVAKYSEKQIEYFNTAPRQRFKLLGLPEPKSKYDLSDDSSDENG